MTLSMWASKLAKRVMRYPFCSDMAMGAGGPGVRAQLLLAMVHVLRYCTHLAQLPRGRKGDSSTAACYDFSGTMFSRMLLLCRSDG